MNKEQHLEKIKCIEDTIDDLMEQRKQLHENVNLLQKHIEYHKQQIRIIENSDYCVYFVTVNSNIKYIDWCKGDEWKNVVTHDLVKDDISTGQHVEIFLYLSEHEKDFVIEQVEILKATISAYHEIYNDDVDESKYQDIKQEYYIACSELLEDFNRPRREEYDYLILSRKMFLSNFDDTE